MAWNLEFNVEANGRLRKATVTAVGDDGAVLHQDRVDMQEAKERSRLVRDLAKRLNEDRKIVSGKVETAWFGAVRDRREQPPPPQDVRPEPPPGPEDFLKDTPPEVGAEAEEMLADPGLLRIVTEDVAELGVAGEEDAVKTVYLAGTSRHLASPLALRIHGPSSSGKSFLVEKVADLFPPEALICATQMTPQALFHMKPGALSHRFVVAGERSRIQDDDQAEATRALREMLSAGRLTKLMPVKQLGGSIETVSIEQEGPIAYVETTTLGRVFDEDENRFIALHTDEQPEQTRRILDRTAEAYAAESTAASSRIKQKHHALQRLLQPLPVIIPYAEKVAEHFAADRVEARRAFPHLLNMVRALTLLHQKQRKTDHAGRLIATKEDYAIARKLLAQPLMRLLRNTISEPAQRFLSRLNAWAPGEFTAAQAKARETSCPSSVKSWLAELAEAGFVEVIEQARGSRPARWARTALTANSADLAGIPDVAKVFPAEL